MKVFTKEENQKWAQQLPGKMCSSCLILRSENTVLMVKAGYKDFWTFPSGIVDERESPNQAAIRETYEETGFTVSEDAVQPFVIIYTSAKEPNDRDRFNFSFISDIGNQRPDFSIPNDEIAEYKWVPIAEIAAFANHKGSYVQFQKHLEQDLSTPAYVEI